ncbi:MAG: L-2,4-diaminobutyrate decarboxylase [Planctomycetota bacterium]|nr:MAG: L-2,4-diaminobutyrate decarboxylase [Planctomycetota bacterium]
MNAPHELGLTPDDLADLDISPQAFERLVGQLMPRLQEQLRALPELPAQGDVDAEELCRELAQDPAPEHGRAFEELLEPYFRDWLPRTFLTPGPGYLAFIPGGGLLSSVLADLLAGATNRYTGVWQAAPALVQLEANALRWLAEWMGFPESARGLLTTGGSQANFSAIVTAREARLGEHLREGVLYTSSQAHLCVSKSAQLAGVLPDRVRRLPVDAHFRMRTDALAEAVAADRAAGLRPFMVVSSAGTTNTGAVDPLEEIGALCAEQSLWHHVDGAYGACFHMVPELRPLLAGMSRADSLALDPHKGFFLPYGNGALLVRDGAALRAAHAGTASYLPDPAAEEFMDPAQYGPELSRDFRGLRLWLSLQLFGAERFRAALAEKRALAVQAADDVSTLPGIEMVAPPQLSLFAFQLAAPGDDLERRNARTRALLQAVNARGRVFLTGCTVDDGRFLARVCVLSFRTRAERMRACVDDLREVAAELLARD